MLRFLFLFTFISSFLYPADQFKKLTLEERANYKLKIEEVYQKHRSNGKDFKLPDFEFFLKEAEKDIKYTNALELFFNYKIDEEKLQAEINRIAENTKQPEVLKEIFDALGNDPEIIAEVYARDILSERILENLYYNDDKFQKELRDLVQSEIKKAKYATDLKNLSGKYLETIVKLKNKDGPPEKNTVEFNKNEFENFLNFLSKRFDKIDERNLVDRNFFEIGKISKIIEDRESIRITGILDKGYDYIKICTVYWEKKRFQKWWQEIENKIPAYLKLKKGNFKISQIRNNSCRDDSWYKLPGPPDERYNSASLLYGNYWVIWGGLSDDLIPLGTGLKYNITSDSWGEVSMTNAPSARKDFMYSTYLQHLYIWGGIDADGNYLNTGAHYDVSNDTWQTIIPQGDSPGDVPSGRIGSVFTYGSYVSLILFGGENSSGKLNDLYFYSFYTSKWSRVNSLNPPSPRSGAKSIVYTSGDDFLLVWGGKDSSNNPLGDGKKYTLTQGWQTIADAPPGNARYDYTFLLSGNKALIWGGIGSGNSALDTGLIYNFTSNSWTQMSPSGLSGRYGHSAVLADSNNMIIWGGTGGGSIYYGDGKKYNISGDSWTNISSGPSARAFHAAGFSGGYMFIWGGKDNWDVLGSGAKYYVSGDSWTSLYDGGAPTARYDYGITWTGTEVIVFGGYFPSICYDNGKKYTLSNDTWSSIADSTGTLEGRSLPAFHYWPSGQSVIVWGGYDSSWANLGDGGIYNVSSNSWTYINPSSDTDTPSPRSYFASAWDPTSEKMYVWGGYIDNYPYYANDGAIYDPSNLTDPWQPIAIDVNTPSERAMVLGVWTGSKFIVWGGENPNWETINTGGIYDPISQSWTPTSETNPPSPRVFYLAKYIGSGMAIWGGEDYTQALGDGSILNTSNVWSSFPSLNAPEPRSMHSGDWNGRDLFIWGGSDNYSNNYFNNGVRYDLFNFTPVSTNGAPKGKTNFEIVWTDGYFFVWGGIVKNGYTNIGALYCSCLNAPPQATNPNPSNGGKACDTAPVNFACDNAEANLFDIYIDSTLECENVSSCSCSKSLSQGNHTWSVVSENHCGTTLGTNWTFDIITTPGSASNPDPADGSFKCSSSPITATWSAGTYAEQYDVYLNSNLVPSCENISNTTCNMGLLSGGDYSWYIVSENICASVQGPTWNFSIDTNLPNAASNPDPADGSSVCPDPDLSWTAASGARKYDVYFDTLKICSDITTTSCDPGSISSGSHSWYVDAKNGCGNTQSLIWSFSIKTAPGQPSNPSPYDGEELCTLTPTLTWNAAPNATSYDVYVDSELKCQDTTNTTCAPGSLNAGTHTWYVISKNGCPTQNNTGPTWTFYLDDGAPGNVTNISPPDSSYPCPNPTLDWNPSPNTRRYDVYLDDIKICSDITVTYCNTTVSSGSHSWYVVSKNKCGSTQTGPFNFIILQTPLQPTVQDKDVCQLNGVNISWSSVDGATGYDLIVDGSTIIQDVSSPYTYQPGNSSSHNYQIRAKNAICTSSWSSQTSGIDENNTPTPTISGDSQNTCPNEFVVLSTQSGMSNYQWYKNGEIIAGANNYQYTATLSGNYTVYYENSYGCGNTSPSHSVTIVECYGPPPVADGKLFGSGAKFIKAADFGTTGNIDVTFDNITCSSHHISILYGNLIGANNFDGYDGCALADGGSSGSTSFNSSSQNNVWYNIIWVTDYNRAGHPGFNYQGGSNGERSWTAVGYCSITSELQNDNTCN